MSVQILWTRNALLYLRSKVSDFILVSFALSNCVQLFKRKKAQQQQHQQIVLYLHAHYCKMSGWKYLPLTCFIFLL